jgi:hypothetical protein
MMNRYFLCYTRNGSTFTETVLSTSLHSVQNMFRDPETVIHYVEKL